MKRVADLQRRADAGERLPLLGLAFAVKDNIHVAGMATTSNCPALSLMPEETAPVVRTLEDAGAVLIGKNTMDQFATGLNGTRSPQPLCRNAIDSAYIPGGSSSGPPWQSPAISSRSHSAVTPAAPAEYLRPATGSSG